MSSTKSTRTVQERSATSWAPFSLLLASVGLAGAASLLYEVLWVRQLGLSLGSTALATSTMLSAFLGGLALGSWISGRRADRLESPVSALAKVQLAAAAVGAVAVPVLGFTGRAYVLVATGLSAGPGLSLALRVVFSLVVMLLPATLFGMAFPLSVVAATRLTRLEWASSGVYAASSFGSAFGASLGGLLLEPAFGLTVSALFGATVNVVAAAIRICGLGFARPKRNTGSRRSIRPQGMPQGELARELGVPAQTLFFQAGEPCQVATAS